MALIIRLRKQGRTNRQSYRLVVTDRKDRRDGKYIENLGWYDPFVTNDKSLFVKTDRVKHWLDNGAMISENVQSLVKKVAPEIIKDIYEKKLAKKRKEKARKNRKKIEKK